MYIHIMTDDDLEIDENFNDLYSKKQENINILDKINIEELAKKVMQVKKQKQTQTYSHNKSNKVRDRLRNKLNNRNKK